MAWETYTIPLEDVKEYLKVEHELENKLIGRLTSAAIDTARQRTNRDFETVPAAVELAILKIIAFWYENRSEYNTIPEEAEEIFKLYYRWPGL